MGNAHGNANKEQNWARGPEERTRAPGRVCNYNFADFPKKIASEEQGRGIGEADGIGATTTVILPAQTYFKSTLCLSVWNPQQFDSLVKCVEII